MEMWGKVGVVRTIIAGEGIEGFLGFDVQLDKSWNRSFKSGGIAQWWEIELCERSLV
jgi:hypothetical protein